MQSVFNIHIWQLGTAKYLYLYSAKHQKLLFGTSLTVILIQVFSSQSKFKSIVCDSVRTFSNMFNITRNSIWFSYGHLLLLYNVLAAFNATVTNQLCNKSFSYPLYTTEQVINHSMTYTMGHKNVPIYFGL